MNWKRVTTIFLRQYFLIKKSFHRWLGIFYWSVLELFLWGFLTVYLDQIGGDKLNVVTVVIGAVILWNFLMRIQQGIAISFLEDVWSRNLMNIFASPLNIKEYITGLVLVGIVSAIISGIFMVWVAWFLFAYDLFVFGFYLVPFIFVLFFFGLALGLYTTAMVLRFGPSSEILAWSIPALIPPFSGVFYAISTLPPWLQVVSFLLPSSYVFEGMRSIVLNGAFDSRQLMIASILAVIFFVISYWLILRTYRYVLREGKLIKLQTD